MTPKRYCYTLFFAAKPHPGCKVTHSQLEVLFDSSSVSGSSHGPGGAEFEKSAHTEMYVQLYLTRGRLVTTCK